MTIALGFTMDYVKRIHRRYQTALKKEKSAILKEFCKVCHYHIKHAIRLLNAPLKEKSQAGKRAGCVTYSKTTLSILESVWEKAGYPWSVRLKALLPTWMPSIRARYSITASTEKELLKMSSRQMDRRLGPKRHKIKQKIYGHTKPGTLLKHKIPIRTKNWDIVKAGYIEMDTVAHCGNSLAGDFIYTLNITDIRTTWVESAAVMGKGEAGVFDALMDLRRALPFPLLGIDSDNGGEFINDHLWRFCSRSRPPIEFTRGRPYESNDNAHIEQKNWTHVRKVFGWDRYESLNVKKAMNDLYENELRCWQNFFQPSVKLKEKVRKGSRLIRLYSPAATPFDRVKQSPEADPKKVTELERLFQSLNPLDLSEQIDRKLRLIYKMASQTIRSKQAAPPSTPATPEGPTTSVYGTGYLSPSTPKSNSPWRSFRFGRKARSRSAPPPPLRR